ncbi:MAG: DUF502 domain-containing protein [Gemmatimonadota bacterium]|jgi:uncharacterized membrane protein
MRQWTLRVFRRWMIAGLIVIAPLGVTVYILWWLFVRVDGLLGQFVYNAIGFKIPGLGLLMLVAVLLVVGWATERAVGNRILGWWQGWLDQVPVVRRLYGASSRIVRTVFGGGRRFFREVVLIQYPSPGRWTVGFITSDTPSPLTAQVENGVTVFVPTAPNPTSGYLVIVPRTEVISMPMTVEEGFTFVLSAGAVAPTSPSPPPPSPSSPPSSPPPDAGPSGAAV